MDLWVAKPWRWQPLPGLNYGRSCMALVVYMNKLLVFGGVGVGTVDNTLDSVENILDSVEMLDLQKLDQGWKLLKSRMPGKRQNHAAVYVDGVILVGGGKNEHGQIIRTIWEFNIESEIWKTTEHCMKTKLGRIAPVMLCIKVMLCGLEGYVL
jgi:hypothetical protein